jgi:peptidoglycan hydrolase-like protein with peptidoglycan-binding domain
MKKIMIATGVAVLAVAMIASAQGFTFNTNLTVGSTGSDVSALQSWLINSGYSIPSIASGAASKGYFGSQTKAAVVAYQTKNGIPSTGFVGPLTRGALNNAGIATVSTPAGTIMCPVGYDCVAKVGTTPTTVPGTVAGIMTPGVAGTLAFSIWTTPSGVTAYKGQAYDVVGYKLQANASDMAVTNFSLDFNTRIWLYASSITIKDETGAVVGTVNNLNQGNFSELTVGSDYRISVPVNLVVKATQSKYLTVNLAFNAVSDRVTAPIVITQAQVRAVDGTGITDTETAGVGAIAGEGATFRTFSYQGSNVGQLVVTVDQNSPAQGLIQVSTAAQTQNVVLGIFDVKVQNEPGTLQSLNVTINRIGTTGADAVHALANVQLKINGQTYSASAIGTTTSFTNLNVPLTADVYVPMTITATIVQDSGTPGVVDNTTLQTVLTTVGLSGATTFNPSVIDATYNSVPNSSITSLTANAQSFTATGVTASNLQTSFGAKTCDTTLATCSQTFKFTYSLTAGNNPVYVSTNAALAIGVTHSTSFTISTSTKDFSDNDSSQDDTSVPPLYFYVGPGSTKTFTVTYQANGSNAQSGTVAVSTLNYGTAAATPNNLFLQSSQISSVLKAVMFQ